MRLHASSQVKRMGMCACACKVFAEGDTVVEAQVAAQAAAQAARGVGSTNCCFPERDYHESKDLGRPATCGSRKWFGLIASWQPPL